MDVSHAPTPISPEDLVAMTCAFPGPQILDVRRDSAFTAAETSLPGALRRDPEAVDAWSGDLEPHREVVTACVHGHQVSQGVAAALAAKGFRVRYLAGGIDGWTSLGFPTVPKPGSPTVWITRARPKIDRIACPWLIRRFVDPDARILYVPSAEVERVAQATGGTAFDVPGAPYTHENESCSFDMFVARHRNQDAALAILARIVRGADTERPDFHPAASGLFAASLGLALLFESDDRATLRHGMVLYDALYLWCRDLQTETHRWSFVGSAGAKQ